MRRAIPKKTISPDIIASIFRRRKINSKVIMSFNSFSEETKAYVLEGVALASDEKPCILSFVNLNHWCLITNERLIWKNYQEFNNLHYETIETVDINKESLLGLGGSFKRQNQEINIKTESGEKFIVNTGEAGGSVFALLSVVGWAVAKKKHWL
ncbi:PH domain-containing protein [Nostoc sp.]|uniref:PH domain-containing protein n=1 Tax=Nostoc sp. TaxID=1180 RepID=UPI002FF4E386